MLKELNEKKIDLKNQMTALVENAKTETRALNEEEIKKFDELEKEINNITETIEREEKVKSMETNNVVVEERTIEEREISAFANFVRNTANGLETRDDLTKGDNGAVIPKTVANKIIEKINEISPVFARATKYNAKGVLSIPKEDNSVDSIQVAYGTEFNDLASHSNKFATIELTGYLYGALTKVSKSLLNNTDFDLVNWVVNKMAEKVSIFLEGELLNGTTGKIAGVAGSYDNVNMKKELASNSAITADELIEIQDLILDSHQNNAIWVMNKSTRTALRQLKDADGKYLLTKDLAAPFGYVLLGKDVYVSDNVAKLGESNKNVIFYGDFSGLAVKEAETQQIQVLREKYATQHAIGVVLWGEIDAKVEDTQKIAVAVTKA